ncbi:Sorting nexin 2B [Glycine soja]|nr:Sorting nexin 2B [Glycine soja]
MMEDHPLSAPKDEMENLVLHDGADDNGNGNDGAGAKSPFSSNYRSAMSTLSESHHHPLSPPILATPADSDPLLSPNSPFNSFLDPPSYADAVFTPFDDDTNDVESSPSSPISLSRSPSSSSEYLKITVSNPVKEQETSNSIVPGSNSYVTYLVTTKTNIPEFGASELRQSVANDWGGSRPSVVEEDKEFMEKKEKINELEQQINGASQQAESLVKAQQDMGETMGELGLAFIKLTKFENEEAIMNSQRVRAADMKGVATAAVKASRLFRELNAQTVKHLQDTLHEYLGLMLAVHSAFSDRSSALLTVQTLLSELSSLESRAEKLEVASSKIFGADKSRVRKLEELQETIRATEDAKNVAIREYERIKENNRSELERLDKERQADFLNMLKGFVVNQVGYAEKIANVWTKVVEDTRGYVDEST